MHAGDINVSQNCMLIHVVGEEICLRNVPYYLKKKNLCVETISELFMRKDF